MKLRVFYHDKCFDGAASASLFARFYRERIRSEVEFVFSGLVHRAGQLFDECMFDGDENAIVDFKYSLRPRLTWWFDHHQSAFLTPEDAEHFRRDTQRQEDSTTRLTAPAPSSSPPSARARFGYEAPDLAELVEWADIIDGAQYPDAQTAVRTGGAGHAS